jgi:hypothetical protein
MFRFLFSLLGKSYESEVVTILREQLEYERAVNQELVETLTSIVNPNRISSPNNGVETAPIANLRAGMWGKRRAALELKDRLKAQTEANSPNLGKPDKEIKKDETIDKLEEELGLETKQEEIH